jgi:hypothetical protein
VKAIPRLVRESGAAVLFGTDTFVNQYARAAEPGDMDKLLFLVCGPKRSGRRPSASSRTAQCWKVTARRNARP